MNTSNILIKWINENKKQVNNYLNDFLCLNCVNSNIVLSCPSHNNGAHNVYMIPKSQLLHRIRKFTDSNVLYYDDRSLTDPHNPYHDSARYLFNTCHDEEDYLRLWLFLLLREYEKNDFNYFQSYQTDFYNIYLELSTYFHEKTYRFYFGNAYYMLPTMEPTYSLYSFNKSIDQYIYELQSQMNYIKATNFMVLINEQL